MHDRYVTVCNIRKRNIFEPEFHTFRTWPIRGYAQSLQAIAKAVDEAFVDISLDTHYDTLECLETAIRRALPNYNIFMSMNVFLYPVRSLGHAQSSVAFA